MQEKFENGEIRADGKRAEPNIKTIVFRFSHI
jgi:hypothetical protein